MGELPRKVMFTSIYGKAQLRSWYSEKTDVDIIYLCISADPALSASEASHVSSSSLYDYLAFPVSTTFWYRFRFVIIGRIPFA